MPSALSIKIGDFLYKNAFPLYNIAYPIFKRKQDKHEIELLHKYVKPGDVVLDIGANIGFYTKILSSLTGPSGKVYSFEPDALNFMHLQKNAGHLKNVELINKAVSDKTGKITLYQSELLNVDHKTYPTENYTHKTEIDCVKADDVVKDKKVDFIKIDIQGFEYFAFLGMTEIFNTNEDIMLITELYPYGIRNSGIQLSDFVNLIVASGFILYKMVDGGISLFTDQDVALLERSGERIHLMDVLLTKKIINEASEEKHNFR